MLNKNGVRRPVKDKSDSEVYHAGRNKFKMAKKTAKKIVERNEAQLRLKCEIREQEVTGKK